MTSSISRRGQLALRARRVLSPVQAVYDRRRGRTSFTDSGGYTDLCARAAADPAVFATFKRQPAYTAVLEHVTCEQGAEYLTIVLRDSPELEPLLERFRENDRLGGPRTCDYGRHGAFSPTTLRYAKVLADLRGLFTSLRGMNIVEIGGGYGGQCFVTSAAEEPASYTVVDLPPCLLLQERYLGELGVGNTRFVAGDGLDPAAQYDLVVSNYAFSECVGDVQRHYVETVLRRSARGYLTCNWVNPPHYHSYSPEALSAAIPGSRYLPEVPQTGVGNAVLVWGDGARVDEPVNAG